MNDIIQINEKLEDSEHKTTNLEDSEHKPTNIRYRRIILNDTDNSQVKSVN